jgi:hypothetical protein
MMSLSMWMHSSRTRYTLVGAFALGLLCSPALAAESARTQDPTRTIETTWPPKGEPQKILVTRDTWVSSMGEEKIGNTGGASQLKLKGHQELSLIDINPAPLKGKIITGALLHVKSSSPKEPLLRVTVSSVSAQWVEGTSSNYKAQEGSSCWSFARYSADPKKAVAWTFPGSLALDAAFGLGHTIWKFADATPPDAEGWQVIAVDADVVAARAAGLSYGFGLWDDVGSEWSYKNDVFKMINNPNRFIYSHEQNNGAPWLEVWTDGTDTVAPDAVAEQGFSANVKDYPAGQALVSWSTPADKGGTKTLGFDVTYKVGKEAAKPMPRYLVPMAAAAGEPVRMHIQDLPFKAGEEIELSITSVDAAGNKGKPFVKKVALSAVPAALAIEPVEIKPFEPSTKLPEVGGLKVAILDLIDKVEAKTGAMLPEHPDGYKGGNHLWSAEKKVIRLQAGRNEFVSFMVNLEGKSNAAGIRLAFPDDSGLRTKTYRLDYVATGAGLMPDAAVPMTAPIAIPNKADPEAAEQTNACLLAEIYVPHTAKAGDLKGTLTVSSNGQSLQIPVDLTIWDFTLPNKLSFLPEMNAYGTVGPDAAGLAYYRLAHEHRTCINRLPYGWDGTARLAPNWNGKTLDFAEWDKQYAPILSGTAFANLPRKGEPVDAFYLPFSESWPVPIWDHYTKDYWPETAFTEEYRSGMQKAYADFVKHLDQRKWHDTQFQFFLNNKVYYKANEGVGWKGSSAPWIFDEPRETQDFWALRWYGLLFHQAIGPVKGNVKAWYRSDISRSDYGRNSLWGVMDVDYFGGSNDQKARQKHDENNLSPVPTYFCEYGGANDPGTSNIAPVTWCILAWTRGAIGVLPWQTIGESQRVWSKGESTCVFYPAQGGPVASIRLKAFRRGQQDVEYLTLLGDTYDAPQFAVAAGLKQTIDLSGRVIKRSEEDAGIIKFDKVDPTSLWQMRYRVGKMVSAKKPEYKRALVDHKSPPIDLSKLPDIGYVKVAPKVEPAKPD